MSKAYKTLENGQVVRCLTVAGTKMDIFSLWEPALAGAGCEPEKIYSHIEVMSVNGKWLGRVGSRSLPPEIEALDPLTKERQIRVEAFYAAQSAEVLQRSTTPSLRL